MSPQTIKLIAMAFSMKKEIKLVFFTLAVICLVPVFAVLILTQAGISIVSDALTSLNPQTAQVDIHDPATGAVVDHVEQTAVWPVGGVVTLEYAQVSPYQLFHTGIDIAGPVTTPVVAFMKGKVIYAGENSWGFGRHVVIDHNHHVTSIYAHLDTINVIEGQDIDVGNVIGTRGNTGWSTGPHLHLEIHQNEIPLNPLSVLSQ